MHEQVLASSSLKRVSLTCIKITLHLSFNCKNLYILIRRDTYSDQDTVKVHRFTPTLFSTSTQYFCQAPGVVDSQDVDVILTAECLNEGKVDLQGHIFHIFVVRGQDAQNHIIRVSEEGKRKKGLSLKY